MSNQEYMVAFEEKVVSFQKENEAVQLAIVKGSDEHLDILLNIKKRLDPLTQKFEALIDDLIPDSNKMTPEELSKTMPVLLDLYSTAIQLVATLKRSKVFNDLKTSIQNYSSQVENLHEFIYDLENFRINGDDDISQLLAEINQQ
jgi:hypothetical protein